MIRRRPQMSTPTYEPTLSVAEVERRFPTLTNITDTDLREETTWALQHTPEYFWSAPASASGQYHHPLARGEKGLWFHTLMAAQFFETTLYETNVQMGKLSEQDADMVRAGILLHDLFKQGYPEDRRISSRSGTYSTHPKHDRLAAQWLDTHTDLPEPVIRTVAAHNGGWSTDFSPVDYNGATQEIALQTHYADMAASRSGNHIAIPNAPDEIAELLAEWDSTSL